MWGLRAEGRVPPRHGAWGQPWAEAPPRPLPAAGLYPRPEVTPPGDHGPQKRESRHRARGRPCERPQLRLKPFVCCWPGCGPRSGGHGVRLWGECWRGPGLLSLWAALTAIPHSGDPGAGAGPWPWGSPAQRPDPVGAGAVPQSRSQAQHVSCEQ